jgi:2-keto-4-pentenoate hydratase/2-oxohepta-3-ene-1,7-dioic acid hydratase in catechol pathway
MRFSIDEIVDYLGRHIALRAGDLIATGTPVRIGQVAGRHLQVGDTMTCWIEGIGELTNRVE